MGALNQLGSAASSFVADPVGSTSNALAKVDKDLSLSQNAPAIAAAVAAYYGVPMAMEYFGAGSAGAGALAAQTAAEISSAVPLAGAGTAAGNFHLVLVAVLLAVLLAVPVYLAAQ